MSSIKEIEQQEQLRSMIRSYSADNRQVLFGRVDDYNPTYNAVMVTILPQMQFREGVAEMKIGWIPLMTPMSGSGWGVQVGPMKGEAYTLIIRLGGEHVGAMFALGLYYTNANKPPTEHAGAGELLLRHKTGSQVKFRENSTIDIHHTSGSHIVLGKSSEIEIKHKGGAKVWIKENGEIEVSSAKAIKVKSGKKVEVLAEDVVNGLVETALTLIKSSFKLTYDTHVHWLAGPKTSTPEIPMPPTDLTINTKAS